MQTIISSISKYSVRDSLIILATDPKQLQLKELTDEETDYIKIHFKEYKQKVFAINKLSRWIFIVFTEKEKMPAARLEILRVAGAKLITAINENKLHRIVLTGLEEHPGEMLAFAEGMALANYQFLKYKKDPAEKMNALNTIDIHSKTISGDKIDRLNISVDAVSRCRDLVNEPVAYLNAVRLAETIEAMGQASGAKVEILNKKKIESLKMGGLLAVNRGSIDPPTFSIMEWKPKDAINKKPYIFVGKGVVYDTGGLNIKTGEYMYNMKCDMSGGAAMASAVYAIAKSKLPVHVIALVPATDNRLNGNAYANGDVITMYDGTRVEVINTDAEGRMILADALSYAKKYNPQLVINAATLTGAAARAIGKYGIVAMQSKAEKEIAQLKKSGEQVGERLVEFPLWKEYGELIKSDIGDIKNIGGSEAGAITAGKFLEHFTDYPFIHLDIAGPAFIEKPFNYSPAGGTGVAVRLLFDFILNTTS